MKKIFGYCILVAAAMAVACSCGRKGFEPLGPGEVTEAFMKAVASGRFGDAAGLCEGETMDAYIKAYEKALSKKASADSTAASIATGILAEIDVTVTEVAKTKDKGIRTVFYTITDVYGDSKEKLAIVKEVEREWRVTEIRDRN